MSPDPLLSDWFSWAGGPSITTTSTSVSIPRQTSWYHSYQVRYKLFTVLPAFQFPCLIHFPSLSMTDSPGPVFHTVYFSCFNCIVLLLLSRCWYDLFAYQLSRVHKPILMCFCNFIILKIFVLPTSSHCVHTRSLSTCAPSFVGIV